MVQMTMQTLQQHSDFARCHQEFQVIFSKSPLAYKDKQILTTLESKSGVSERNIKFWFRTMKRHLKLSLLDSSSPITDLETRFQSSALLDKDEMKLTECSRDTGKTTEYIREWFEVRRRWLKIQIFIKSQLPGEREFEQYLKEAERVREEKHRQSIEVEKMMIEDEDPQSIAEFQALLQDTEAMERRVADESLMKFENILRATEFERKHPRFFSLSAGGVKCEDRDPVRVLFSQSDHHSNLIISVTRLPVSFGWVSPVQNLTDLASEMIKFESNYFSSIVEKITSESLLQWILLLSSFT